VSLAFTYRNVERKGTSTKMIQKKKKEIKRGREGGREKERERKKEKEGEREGGGKRRNTANVNNC
jgi:hypothetical protein